LCEGTQHTVGAEIKNLKGKLTVGGGGGGVGNENFLSAVLGLRISHWIFLIMDPE